MKSASWTVGIYNVIWLNCIHIQRHCSQESLQLLWTTHQILLISHGTHQVQLTWYQGMMSKWCLMLEEHHSHLRSTWWHLAAGTVEAIEWCRVWCLRHCTHSKCERIHQWVQVSGAFLLQSIHCLLVSILYYLNYTIHVCLKCNHISYTCVRTPSSSMQFQT